MWLILIPGSNCAKSAQVRCVYKTRNLTHNETVMYPKCQNGYTTKTPTLWVRVNRAPYSRQYSGLSRSYGRSWRICGSSLLRPTNLARSYHGRRDIVWLCFALYLYVYSGRSCRKISLQPAFRQSLPTRHFSSALQTSSVPRRSQLLYHSYGNCVSYGVHIASSPITNWVLIYLAVRLCFSLLVRHAHFAWMP